MPSEFKAVEAYLSHLQSIHSKPKMLFNTTSVTDSNADQKVPQLNVFNLSGEDMMFSQIKIEPADDDTYYKLSDPFSFSEDVKLLPVTSSNCTPVELNDQQLTAEQSPIQLLDLDHVNNDVTFYHDPLPSMSIKQEMSAVPSGCMDYDMDTQSQESFIFGMEQTQSQSMEVFLINQVKKDIDAACTTLNISSDPFNWNMDQTRNWVIWTLQQYQLPIMEACMFQLPGAVLCMLTETEFLARSSDCGSTLYSQLEIWKNACNLYQPESLEQILPFTGSEVTYMSYPDVRVNHPTPSVSPAPSSSSQDSYNSSSGSSIGFPVPNSVQFDQLHEAVESETVVEKPVRNVTHVHKQTIHLWQFLKELLLNASSHGNCIKWLDREKGIFKIEDSARVARLWGKRKNRPAMNYDKLSRSIRQYYKKGIIKKTDHSKRLVYQFCKPYLS